MKNKETAYLLWVPGLFGVAGLQRIYIGKTKTGILWLLTVGLVGVGTIYDVFTLGKQVKKANSKLQLKSE